MKNSANVELRCKMFVQLAVTVSQALVRRAFVRPVSLGIVSRSKVPVSGDCSCYGNNCVPRVLSFPPREDPRNEVALAVAPFVKLNKNSIISAINCDQHNLL